MKNIDRANPAPRNPAEMQSQINMAAKIWTAIVDNIFVCEDSDLQGNGLTFIDPRLNEGVIRVPKIANIPTTLIRAARFVPIYDRDQDIVCWEARTNGYVFRILND